jgi:ATP-binding cassette subfamily B protein
MYDRFETLAAGKSAIYVTHRMASTKRTGHVLVLGNGRLLEYGTHAELMAHNGDYARMYSLQANRYTN